MSIRERGQAERETYEREQRDREAYWRESNRKHTITWFHKDFYREHIVPNPKPFAYPSYIEDPENPFPEVTEWEAEDSNTRAPSTFVCEGLRYKVWWKYEGGGDRAYWDDGWWPQWSVQTWRRMRFLPFVKRIVWVPVYGPANVAEAVS